MLAPLGLSAKLAKMILLVCETYLSKISDSFSNAIAICIK